MNSFQNLLLKSAAFFLISANIFSAEFTLKYAAMAPQGSLWHKYSEKIRHEIEEKSQGRIEIKAYYGGIAGDERTMGKKLRAGIIDIASFSGIGLGEILPSARIFELPMFLRNYSEVDRVQTGLDNYFEGEFDRLNLILGAWGEGGFVYLMSTQKMNQFMDMKGMKVWAPSGDLIVKSMFQKYGFVPVFLGMESVLTQLQTGGLSAVYAPPMAAIGLQWYNEVNYIYNLKLTYSTGATLINKKKLYGLPRDLQKIVLGAVKKYSRELVLALREENDKTMKLFLNKGIKEVDFPDSDLTLMEKYSGEVQDELAGKLYPKNILERARKLRDAK